MRKLEELQTYQLLEKKELNDTKSYGYILKHKKTGAKVVLMQNDDENKVFFIGFRTPPVDSTGAAHIVEHSVLCGSKEFPVKDPFIELAKGSLNTFLNAMTYPDKTVYPVASCNEKDFQNLLHVYLDAVFYPNIYREEKIFRQEGWHYEMETEDDALKLNGVVYSEMRGAFSSPDDVLERHIMNSLYPDNAYGFESGGDPEVIPTLTYETFLEFHRKYYHPSNSYIYLYGNMDMVEKLEFIDMNYLSEFEAQPADSEIELQKPFNSIRNITESYPISEEESEENNTYLSFNKVIETNMDQELYLAFQVLDYCLCSAPGAPLKQALIDAGIGKDVYSVYEEGIMQPFFSVIAKNANANQKQKFLEIYQSVLQELIENGVDKKALYAALNYYEFKYREADFGSYPKGLMYGLQMLDSWLYDERQPFLHMESLSTFSKLREKVEEGYFEKIIEKYLLTNTFGSFVMLLPEKGLSVQKDKRLAKKLAEHKASLKKSEIEEIVRKTKELKEYQETADSPEALLCIPHLTRSDMKQEAEKPVFEEHMMEQNKILFHPIMTNGIGYVRFMFTIKNIPEELFPYLSILKNMIGLLRTDHYSYADLFNEINRKTGGMNCTISTFSRIDVVDNYTMTLDMKVKALYRQMPDAFELLEEVLLHTKWDDFKRNLELLEEIKSRAQSDMISAGHAIAVQRALSYQSEVAAAGEILSGITQFRLIKYLVENYDEKKGELAEKLQILAKMIFRPENLLVDYIAEKEAYETFIPYASKLRDQLYHEKVMSTMAEYHPKTEQKNEGFMSATQVQYVARVGNFRREGLPFTGSLRVLRVMLSYDYLWNNVRVTGGAYGCMCNFSRTGESYFVSYRDPQLKRTIQVYEKISEYLKDFKETPENNEKLTQFVIGAIGEIDKPKTPQSKGNYSLDCYMAGITFEILQQEREELLGVTPTEIQRLATYIDAVMKGNFLCTLGGEEKIKEDAAMFLKIEALFS